MVKSRGSIRGGQGSLANGGRGAGSFGEDGRETRKWRSGRVGVLPVDGVHCYSCEWVSESSQQQSR